MRHSYIIRIYRHEKDNPRTFVGTVEKVGEPEKTAFTCYDELWERLNGDRPDKTKRSKRTAQGGEHDE